MILNEGPQLTPRTLRRLSEVDTLRGCALVALDYVVIGALALFSERNRFPSEHLPLYLLVLVLTGTRLNSIGVLMHEAAHFRIARNRKLNDWIGELLLSWPVFFSMKNYRRKHLAHHAHLNTERDPDFVSKKEDPDYWHFPRTRAGTLRILLEDLIGLRFYKFYQFIRKTRAFKTPESRHSSVIRIIYYAVLFGAITALQLWRPYLLYWFLPAATWAKMSLHLRTICDHLALPPDTQPEAGSRTLIPNFIERILFAPHSISYHAEHHLCPSVPGYNLNKLHLELMKSPTYGDRLHVTRGYLELLSECAGIWGSPKGRQTPRSEKRAFSASRKSVILVTIALSFLATWMTPNDARAEGRKIYQRALVLSGGGLNPGMFIGMADALEDVGLGPDLVIGSCGGSVAAAIIHAFPNRQARLNYLVSREFYQAFSSLDFQRTDIIEQIIPVVASVFADKYVEHIPDLFGDAVATFDIGNLAHELQHPFSSASGRIHALIVAERLDFAQNQIGSHMDKSEKLFTETYFTDKKTASGLKNFQSPIALAFPGSRIQTDTETITDISLAQALRGSIADPFLLTPSKIGEHNYMTGAGDLWPYELAQHLAAETIITTSVPFTKAEQAGFDVTFNVPMNTRLTNVKQSAGTYWIDDGSFFDSKNQADIKRYRLDTFLSPSPALIDPLPTISFEAESSLSAMSFEDFQKVMMEQWEEGRALVQTHMIKR